MFVGDEVLLDVTFTVARARLANLARGGSLLSVSEDAYNGGITGLVRVGPLGSAPALSRLVQVHFRDLVERNDSAGLDHAILHRVAAATIRNFINRVAAGITGHAATAESGTAGPGPSWLPPAPDMS